MAIDRRILSILYANGISDVNKVQEFLGEKNNYYEIKINNEIRKLRIPGYTYNDVDNVLENAIESAKNYNNALDLLGSQVKAAGMQIVGGMLPALVQVSSAMSSTTNDGKNLDTAVSGIGTAFKVMVTGIIFTVAELEYFGSSVAKVAAMAKAAATGDFAAAGQIWDDTQNLDNYYVRIEQIGKMTKVRLSFVAGSQKSYGYGQTDRQETPILTAETYKNAFERIESAIFVRSSN